MKAMGLDTVRVAEIWPGWEVLEPEPGVYAFEELDAYVDCAHAHGLSVIMGIGINNPPFWVFSDIEDVRCIGNGGFVAKRRVQSANHDNPEYRKVMQRFIKTHVRHYADHPAVVAWQLGNEIRYGVDIPENPCTHARFRDWLAKQYGEDLDRLNREWAVHYRNWQEIYPYKSDLGAPTEGLTPLALATRKFLGWSLEELIEWGSEIVKRHSQHPVFHNSHNISANPASHWRLAAPCDLVVQDIYPTTSSEPQIYNTFLLDSAVSVGRHLEKDLWIGETSIGQYGTYSRNSSDQRQIEALVMEMLGCGIKGLLYFRHKPPKYEQPHKFTGSQAALRRDGSALPYVKTPEHISEMATHLEHVVGAARPVAPEIAIYYPEESLLLSKDVGYDALQRDTVFGTSTLFNRNGLPVDILPTDQLLKRDVSAYKMIYLPVTYLLPTAVGVVLENYVAQGGTLVSECRLGYVDELGWLFENQPGAGLHEVFGVKEDLFFHVADIKATIALGDSKLEAVFPRLCQTLRLDGATACGWNEKQESIAAVNSYGDGTAVYLGVAPSLLYPMGKSKYDSSGPGVTGDVESRPTVLQLIAGLAGQAGVETPLRVQASNRDISMRFMETNDSVVAMLCNHGLPAKLSLPSGARTIARGSNGELNFEERTGTLEMDQWDWCMVRRCVDSVDENERN